MQDSRKTDVFVHLPSTGYTSLRDVRAALERVVEGIPTWSDVRLIREAIDVLEARVLES